MSSFCDDHASDRDVVTHGRSCRHFGVTVHILDPLRVPPPLVTCIVFHGLCYHFSVQLIGLYGEDARLFLLQCLVEETGFKEQKAHTHHGNKDAQKVRKKLHS